MFMADRFGFDWTGIAGTHFWRQPQIGRRLFFRHLASAVGGYFLMPGRPMETVARAAGNTIGTAKNCIFVLMSGGPSHIDTFDLKEGAWTPAFAAPESYGNLRWPRGLMPKLGDQLDSIALVRSVRSWAAVHQLARVWVQIGRNPTSAMAKISPHLGSVVSLELGARDRVLPAFAALNAGGGNPGQGYLDPQHAPFFVNPGGGGLPNTTHRDGAARFDTRYGLRREMDAELLASGALGPAIEEMDSFNLAARRLMYNDAVNRVFAFDQNERARYGTTAFGNACIAARNLLRARLGTRFIEITIGGWDQHQNIYAPNAGLQNLTRQFDNGLGTLIADLKSDGLLDETLIMAMGEFGRTVGAVNAQGGRDHFLQQAVLLAGARIRGGRALGATDAEGRTTVEPGWGRDRDIRAEDIEATLYSALGIDWTKILRDDPLGRGFEYVPFADRDLYGPVHELWG
jgi:hypothetical protein